MHMIDHAETELRLKSMAIARLKLDTERAELEARKAVAEKLTWYAGKLAQCPKPPPRVRSKSPTAEVPPEFYINESQSGIESPSPRQYLGAEHLSS